jgi:hypothetical protein
MHDRKATIRAIVELLANATVTVFGDYCLDAYWDIFDGPAELSICFRSMPPQSRS